MLSNAARSTRGSLLIRGSANLKIPGPKLATNLLLRANMTSSHTVLNDTKEHVEELPWYLRESQASKLDKPIFKADFPELPAQAPTSLGPIIKNMIDKLGLDNFKVFDLRGREEELPISSMSDFMIICQGKSEKHLQNASQELLTFIKREFGTHPYVEGLIKPNSTIRMRRRMKRRMSSNRKQNKDEDFGLGVNSWIMIDSKIDNVFIHLLTPERRKIVNLEYMWCTPEEKEIYKQEEEPLAENGREAFGGDSVFSGISKRFYSTKAAQIPDQLALQHLKFNDIESFLTISKTIQDDPEIAAKTLSSFIECLKLQNINQITPELLKQYYTFFSTAFPLQPTKLHWEHLFEFQSILHLLSPLQYPFCTVKDVLKAQISSGEQITIPQFATYLDFISQSPELNIIKQDIPEFSSTVHLKFKYLFEILSIVEVNRPDILDHDQILLRILKIPTYHHLYNEITPDQSVILHKNFKNLLQILFADRVPSDSVVQFVLTTYAKNNDVESFYSFWESIHRLRQEDNQLIVDERPWNLLFDLLVQDYRENLVERLVNKQLSKFVTLNPDPNPETKTKVNILLNKFDESGKAYPQLREHFL